MVENGYTPEEMMAVMAARQIENGQRCFVGIGLPSTAANLARLTHAPDVVLIYESGTIGAKPSVLPLSIGDSELAETADAVVSVPEIFAYWLQSGRIDVGFLGAAQLDRYGNINTTVIGEYDRPKVRLPGAGGAPEIAAAAREVFIMVRHGKRAFVDQLDFVTSVGRGEGNRAAGATGAGPTRIITDLAMLTPDPKTNEFTLTTLYPGVTVDRVKDATGWELKVADRLDEPAPPTEIELTALRELQARTARAHAAHAGQA